MLESELLPRNTASAHLGFQLVRYWSKWYFLDNDFDCVDYLFRYLGRRILSH